MLTEYLFIDKSDLLMCIKTVIFRIVSGTCSVPPPDVFLSQAHVPYQRVNVQENPPPNRQVCLNNLVANCTEAFPHELPFQRSTAEQENLH
jgi:hypothetical protein